MSKKLLKYYILILSLLLIKTVAFAQIDTFQLEQVVINSNKIKTAINSGNQTIEFSDREMEQHAMRPLSQLLRSTSGLFVKSYGIGSLATISGRGMGSAHTSVLWNGFNIQNPMHGTIDVSLVPTFFSDELKLESGSSSALYGSGNLGGTIHLENKPNFQNRLYASGIFSVGSFNDFKEAVTVGYSNHKFQSVVKVFNQNAVNDFPFLNLNGTEKRMPNARVDNFGLHQDNFFFLNQHHQIETHFWYQNTVRQIPPTLTQAASDAQQEDETYRMAVEWTGTFDKLKMNARAAYFDEEILYFSSLIQPALSNSTSLFGELESNYQLTQTSNISGGIHLENNKAISEQNYTDDYDQNRLAVFGAYQTQLKNNWQLSTAVRKSITDGNWEPITGHIGFEKKWRNNICIKGNIHKNYRLPTINELFWNDGSSYGNPDLLPENSIGQELTVAHNIPKYGLQFSMTGYHNQVENWILWRSFMNSFSPINQRSVRAIGLEANGQFHRTFNQFEIATTVRYALTNSIIQKDDSQQDLEGSQLIYTPKHNLRGSIATIYKNFELTYFSQTTGKRFTSTDNKNFLDAFTIGDLHLSTDFKFSKTKIGVHAKCNNMWNTSYEVLAFRPMPGRHFELELRVKL